MSSPSANEPMSACIALYYFSSVYIIYMHYDELYLNVENRSGLPFPKARKVTPVYIWFTI